jgi:hypothetical protein
MANIVLKTFAAGDEGQGTVTPQDDSLIYQNAVSVNGIFGGATVTLTGANTLHVASGFGIICGRFFEINESDISVQLSSSGTLNGRLKIHLDLNNADNPIEIVTETGATLPALSGDSNININGGAFDMELCTFSVNELTISSLVNTFPTIDNTSKQIRRKTAYAVNDFALCQSASDSLIFVCTTAGTTAIQEPTAYATVTDGNTVTDGTAVFKAVSVSGQITKLSKTEDLIAYVQTTLTASKAYAVGEQFIYNGFLYEATASIAQGGTIVINGNVVLADSVAEQISLTQYTGYQLATNSPLNSLSNVHAYRLGKLVIINLGGQFNSTSNTYNEIITGMPIPVTNGYIFHLMTSIGKSIPIAISSNGVLQKANNLSTDSGYYSQTIVYFAKN